jgi:hypothetical protein
MHVLFIVLARRAVASQTHKRALIAFLQAVTATCHLQPSVHTMTS